MKGFYNMIPRKVRRAIAFGAIVGMLALPMIGCGDADMGEIGSRIDANQAQTAQLPSISGGHATIKAQPTQVCRNPDGSYNC